MQQYNKIFLTFLLTILFGFQVSAQHAERAASTKILDALNQLPAQNKSLYDRLMKDIESTGSEGVELLLTMLNKNDASLPKVEYAINGFVTFVSANDFDKTKRDEVVKALKKNLDAINAKLTGDNAKDSKTNGSLVANKEFLTRQLLILKAIPACIIEPTPVLEVKEAEANLKNVTSAVKKNATSENVAARAAALNDYINSLGVENASKVIEKALKDPCRQYRTAAIYAINSASSTPEILSSQLASTAKYLGKLKDDAKIDVLYWFGQYSCCDNSASVLPLLKSKNNAVVEAAAWAITKMGKEENIPSIVELLKSSDAKRVDIAQSCLKSYKGDVCTSAVSLLANEAVVSDMCHIAIINLIAARKAMQFKSYITEALASKSSDIELAAYNALKSVSVKEDLESLYALLERSKPTYTPSVQDAISEAISSLPLKEQFAVVSKKKDAVSTDKQALYWPLVFKTADYIQLLAICNDLAAKNGNASLRDAAFAAYMKTISNKLSGEQRLLMLRNAMSFARTDAQKQQTLVSVGQTGTFQGIIFAGKYIEDAQLQQAAAQAVRISALSNINHNGPQVVALLKRAAEVITGQDAGYEITAINQHIEKLAKQDVGFVSIFNGKDLVGWKGLLKGPFDNPFQRAKLSASELAKAQVEADEVMDKGWKVEDGTILFTGQGRNLCTEKQYGNFEMYVDWYLYPEGPEADAGIYLRGTPQVQIWDTARVDVGAQVGSGGLYNNSVNPRNPLKIADNGLGQWNSFYIKMVGERVTVYLNGELVVNNAILENYWNRSQPIFPIEQIELQAHGSKVAYRDIYIKELPSVEPYTLSAEEKKEGFKILFDGTSLHHWQGNKMDYTTDNGTIAVSPTGQGFGNLYTNEEYDDFVLRFEFKLTAGANNGIGVRTPINVDAAYNGMEIQILDHYDEIYHPGLKDYQYHGSVYGIIPSHNNDALKPLGEWNVEEIYFKGNYVRVTLNGVVITEGDIAKATENGTYDKLEHPGLFNKKGYIGLLGHGSQLWFKDIRIKRLNSKTK